MGRAGPGFYDNIIDIIYDNIIDIILRAGPGAGVKLAGPGRARAGKIIFCGLRAGPGPNFPWPGPGPGLQ